MCPVPSTQLLTISTLLLPHHESSSLSIMNLPLMCLLAIIIYGEEFPLTVDGQPDMAPIKQDSSCGYQGLKKQ